ncbi:hypothetical protein [Marinicella litoralis]|uniref:Uncharacterized protein n=1 Tax=Marinicella litoralis TaxID=644220 RepID=A0A4R6XWG9_9GAMM|nr:hypothetical protein [Marinicella litoralis]TDR22790.1 hypothetical protein C8D91_1283 [Marinicella litoralis]
MNSMLKTLLTVSSVLLLANCNRLVKEEAYLEAESTPSLKVVDGKDMPRTSNNLNIPEVDARGSKVAPDSRPPEMAFARRRSEDENVVIIESQGMPTIEIFNDKDAWDLMIDDHGYNWQLLSEDQENCQATFRFYDPITEEVSNRNFFKKLFTINSNYVDRSGEYVLTCLKLPQKQQIWLQTIDFEAPSSYVVDDLFIHIYEAATATETAATE